MSGYSNKEGFRERTKGFFQLRDQLHGHDRIHAVFSQGRIHRYTMLWHANDGGYQFREVGSGFVPPHRPGHSADWGR